MLLSDVCLTSVCLTSVFLSVAYIRPNSRKERPRKTKTGTEIAHVTHHFQGQKVKNQLVADVSNSQHAGTGATWRINAKILSTCRGRGHIVSPRAQLVTHGSNCKHNYPRQGGYVFIGASQIV